MHYSSHAKINLFLKIGKKRKNGYHELQSVMQPIALHDIVWFEKLVDADEILIESNNKEIETKENLAYIAADLLKKKYGVVQGVKIRIEKSIPLAAGLGGGSSNAAVALQALSKMWKLKVSDKKLFELALSIGSDVPFFVIDEAAYVAGVGEKVTQIKKAPSINLVLINPGFKVSTEWAYDTFDRSKTKSESTADHKQLIKDLSRRDVKRIAKNCHNDFDVILEKKYPVIKEIKRSLRKFDAAATFVSGSGPTVVGVYETVYAAREAYHKMLDQHPFVFLTKTI